MDVFFIMVVGKWMVKIYIWYDNEMGYVMCIVELVCKVGLV